MIAIIFIFLIVTTTILFSQLSNIKKHIQTMEMDNKKILSRLSNLQQDQPTSREEIRGQEVRDQRSGVRGQASEPDTPIAQPKPTSSQLPVSAPPPIKPDPSTSILQEFLKKDKEKPPCIKKPDSGIRAIFSKIWRWILVGDESKNKNISFESAMASTWMMRIGIIFITTLAAYFLKLSIERELLSPTGRFAVGIGFGIIMLIAGIKLITTRYKMIGEGLLGGGIAVLYLCIYAGDAMYHIMPTPLAFALMTLITVTAGFLAVKLNSMLVAIFGIIGGYITPAALSSQVLSLPGFYSYILILSIAVLIIVLIKQWRLLTYLSFILTYGLYFFLSMDNYDKTTDFAVAIIFLTLLFVVQSLTVCIHNIIKRQQSTILEVIHLILNALVYSAGGYFLIIEAHGRQWPAAMSLGLALFYMLYIFMFLRRGLRDRLLLLCLISLSAAFTAWTLPLVFEKESLTIALALLAFVFLWLGRKVKSNFLQSLSYLIYGVVFFRIALLDMPANYHLNSATPTTWGDYFKDMFDRLFTFGVSIGSIIGAFLLSKREAKESSVIFPENDINAIIPANITHGVLFWSSVAFIFVFLNLEFNAMFLCWEPMRLPMQTLLWGGLTLFLFNRMLSAEKFEKNNDILFTLTGVILAVSLVKLIAFDCQSWNLTANFIYNQEYALMDAAMRLFDFGVMLAVILLIWRVISGSKNYAQQKALFGYAGLALLFVYASLELRTLLHWKMESFIHAGISILWSLFAICFIFFGISKRCGLLRALGLGLFVIVCGKVAFYDLRGMEIIYRIIALMVVGITLLLGSFAYLKSNKLEVPEEKSK
ncbi:MAG: DUF2339 domain-containing protein [Kiritimatiellae bacterium]|jgi:uncharacterized membrane protein|nr:DUF2339 domain-containing protein [Kiritimatiellia bacterium]